ncbi:MAG: prohibitin family protein [bacterium]|nr:prohibitin family protein [bacterium]
MTENSNPKDSLPEDSQPVDSTTGAPIDTAPADSTPADSTSANSTPADSTSGESKPRKSKFKNFFRKLKIKSKLYWRRHKFKIIAAFLVFLFLFAYFWHSILISVYAGEAAVKWKRFGGTVLTKVYGEGLHFVLPWDTMAVYTLRFQEHHDTVRILSKAGLYVDMDISYRFHPDRKSHLPDLHQLWGPDYVKKFVIPEAKAAAIAILGNYSPRELYSISTTKIQSDIEALLDKEFENSHIVLHDFLITRLALPKTIKDAIEKKLTQQQLLEEYNFKISVAQKERQRKVIEATGIKLFQRISQIPILKWKGLDVTSEISRSKNAKVVIIGSGPGGLPVILNADSNTGLMENNAVTDTEPQKQERPDTDTEPQKQELPDTDKEK